MDQTGVVILALLATLPCGYLGWWLWQKRRVLEAKQWPRAEATIESGSMEVVDRVGYTNITLPVFAFSYIVGGQYYSGRFALLPYITDPGPTIIERMVGRKLSIGHNPERPEAWFIPDELIEGCKVEQKLGPHFLPLYQKD